MSFASFISLNNHFQTEFEELSYLFLALLAVVGVLAVQHLVLDELSQRVLKRAGRLDGQVESEKAFVALVPMRTRLAHELIGELALEKRLEGPRLTPLLAYTLVDLIAERDEEVESVLLLAHIHLLAPHAKGAPKRARHVVLELGGPQVSESSK